MRILCIGAHPDDCEYRFAGTAVKLASEGHALKFLAVTNGDAGHHEIGGGALARRRRVEQEEAARRLDVAWEVLDNHDGEYLATLENRLEIIRQIREWQADVVLSHRPNDYHPDHRNTGIAVQDSAYMVTVPNVCPGVPALRRNPIYLYLEDPFRKPNPFVPDIVVAIDDTWDRKVDSLDAHECQFYEWLPWLDGLLDQVPGDHAARKGWLSGWLSKLLGNDFRDVLASRYGPGQAARIKHCEAFEVCEYGRQPSKEELESLFPR